MLYQVSRVVTFDCKQRKRVICESLIFLGTFLMRSFTGVDFLHIDDLLGEGELFARRTTREFVEQQVIPAIAEHKRNGVFPMSLVAQLGELGFFGATLSDYGCPVISNVVYGLVMQELEWGDSGLRSFVSVQSALVMYPIHSYGSLQQKEKWLPRLRTGEAIGCFGLTDPQFGSNPGGMLSRATRRGNS